MEKNKSVLIASISGIVACLVCIGLVFLFTPKGSNELKGNDKLPTQQDEIKLGDDCSSCVSYCMATSGHTLDYCNTSCGCSGSTTPQTYCCCNVARTTCSNRYTRKNRKSRSFR